MNNYLVPIRYRHIKFSISDQEKKKNKRKEDKRNRERERNESGRQNGELREERLKISYAAGIKK